MRVTDDDNRVKLKAISGAPDYQHEYINASYINVSHFNLFSHVLSSPVMSCDCVRTLLISGCKVIKCAHRLLYL